jgi:hypothetical protein
MFSDWVSFLAYHNLFGIKGFIVVVVDDGGCQTLVRHRFKGRVGFLKGWF